MLKKDENMNFRSFLLQMRIKALEEESRSLLTETIMCEVRFAKIDLANGVSYLTIVKDIGNRYKRFYGPIIKALEKEMKDFQK